MIPPTTRFLVYGVYNQGSITTDSCDHRMIHIERILRRSLVQPRLRAGPALRLDQVPQGLIQLFLETPEDGDCTASQSSCPTVWLSSWGKSFSTHSIWTSLVSSSVVSLSPTMCLCGLRPWPCLLDGLPTDAGWLLLSASKAISSPGWTSPISSACPQKEVLHSLTSL